MIAVQLLPYDEVCKKLEELGCKKLGIIAEETAHWETAWGFDFTVPEIGPDKMCPMYVFHEIVADVEKSRPNT